MFRILYFAVIAVLVFLDRLAKHAAAGALSDGGTVDFLFGLFRFRYVENTGAAFSSFAGNRVVLIVFTSLVIILCLFILLAGKVSSKFVSACLLLIVAGGIGNLIDRIISGFVIDFIEPMFMNFAVFNVADIFITVGAFMLIFYEVYLLIKEKRQGKKTDNND